MTDLLRIKERFVGLFLSQLTTCGAPAAKRFREGTFRRGRGV
jgi:hypothetical protein